MAVKLYKCLIGVPESALECLDNYFGYVKIKIPEFAQYDSDSMYFTIPESEVADRLNSLNTEYNCGDAKTLIEQSVPTVPDVISKTIDPTIYENPKSTGLLWVNRTTGETYVCIDNTEDNNIWVGVKSGKLVRPVPNADKFDFFEDNSCILFCPFNKNTLDVGGLYNGKEYKINWTLIFDELIPFSGRRGTIKFKNLPIDENTDVVTVASWLYWDGTNSVMPYGWDSYNLHVSSGKFGFNTFNGDIYGIDFKEYKKKWIYTITEFRKGVQGDIYINGIPQTCIQQSRTFNTDNAKMSSSFSVFGYNLASGYRSFGGQSRLRLFNRSLTQDEKVMLTYAEVDLIRSVGGDI